MLNNKIDAVIMFVDMNDIEWRERYNKYVQTHEIPIPEINNVEVRSRDYGTLKCLLRSIDKNLPWINNVYLVVQSKSQVPNWINTKNVNVILHEDFIPKDYLPLYNTFSIQTHLHLIPGLSEKFLCISDDSIFMNYINPEDFFINDKIVQPVREVNINFLTNSSSKFSHYFKYNASEIAKNLCNVKNDFYYMDEHGVRAMFKSIMEEVYNSIDIKDHISTFRNYNNTFMNTFVAYAWLKRKIIHVTRRNAYIDFKAKDIHKLRNWLYINKFNDQISVNDQDLNPAFDKELFYDMVEESLQWLFPEKSKKYEI